MARDKDIILKDYLAEDVVYADVANLAIFKGKQLIDKKKLVELDPKEILATDILPKGYLDKERDLLKKALIMQDDIATYIVIGIENQSEIDLRMPLRALTYDVIRYNQQLQELEKKHNEEGYTGRSKVEMYSKYFKEDSLLPVITIVVYYGKEEWNAPLTFQDMLKVKHSDILECVPQYKMTLLDVRHMSDEDLAKLKTQARLVFKLIRCAENRKKFTEEVNNNPAYKHISTKAAKVVQACTDFNFAIDDTKEEIDMAKAVSTWEQELIEEGKLKMAKGLLQKGFPIDSIADVYGVSVAKLEAMLKDVKLI